MSDQFLAEIRIFAGNFAPAGWAFCDGQPMPITQNTALFALLGTTYGGDGTTYFSLPDLNARAPLHPGQGHGLTRRELGESGGAASHALQESEMPPHSHALRAASAAASTTAAQGNLLASVNAPNPPWHDPTMLAPMAAGVVGSAGGGAPHENRQPFLTLSFIIALQGIFPPRA